MMAIDREGTEVKVGDLVEIYGKPRSGRKVIAVADAGVYVEGRYASRSPEFLRDADRCYSARACALMATLEFALKILGSEDIKPGDRPIEFGMAIIGTSKEQRVLAAKLLRRAAEKIEEDTMKKFGTGEVLPEPDDDQAQAQAQRTEADRAALAAESAKGPEGGD